MAERGSDDADVKEIRGLIGQRFGRLVVSARAENPTTKKRCWSCRCDCGGTTVARTGDLRSGNTQSCGCLRRDRIAAACTLHGLHDSSEYRIWADIRHRCGNPRASSYAYYGGRGITVCHAWDDFLVFLRDMGPRPSLQHSIDRRDNDGNYAPGNCRWATRRQQGRNTRANRMLEHNGERLTLTAWAERLGVPTTTLWHRLTRMSLAEVVAHG